MPLVTELRLPTAQQLELPHLVQKPDSLNHRAILEQYYNLIRLGKSGHREIHWTCQDVATYLANAIDELGPFELVSHL